MSASGKEQPGKEGEKGAPASPQFVPAEEFKRLETVVLSQQNLLTEMREGIQAIRASRQAEPAPKEEPPVEVTDAEIQEAFAEGKPDAIRKLVQAENAKLRQEITALRATGLTSIAGVVKHIAKGSMPYYDEFKGEIDSYIARLPDDLKLDPGVYKAAHDAVVGENIEKIKARAVEEALRKGADPSGSQPGSVTGREKDSGKTPTVEELFGKEAADALSDRGLTADQHAQRLGYKDWPEYAALAVKQQSDTGEEG